MDSGERATRDAHAQISRRFDPIFGETMHAKTQPNLVLPNGRFSASDAVPPNLKLSLWKAKRKKAKATFVVLAP